MARSRGKAIRQKAGDASRTCQSEISPNCGELPAILKGRRVAGRFLGRRPTRLSPAYRMGGWQPNDTDSNGPDADDHPAM